MHHADKGKHVELPFVEYQKESLFAEGERYYKCKAFKLEPIEEPGKATSHIVVDGQVLESQAISVQVNQAMMNVFCTK